MNISHLLFGFDGRISRTSFWIGLLIIAAVEIAVMLALGIPFIPEQRNPLPVRIQEFVVQLILLYPTSAVIVKRLHDRDYPGPYAAWIIGIVLVILVTELAGLTGDPKNLTWLDYSLAFVTVVVVLAFLIDLGFRRGSVGDNPFGPDPVGGRTELPKSP